MVLKILKLGYNVMLSDVDVYWFENPLPLLYSFGSAVLVAQSDEFKKTGAYSKHLKLKMFTLFLTAKKYRIQNFHL